MALFCLALPPRSSAAETAITRGADGVFSARTDHYVARIGADGNLHSLVSGGTEFLYDGVRGLVGGGYMTIREGTPWSAEAYTFAGVSQTAANEVTATGLQHVVIYRFLPDAIEVVFSHTADPTIWYIAVNPVVTNVVERLSGEPIPHKTAAREGKPHLLTAGGATVTLPPGSYYYVARNSQEKPDADPMVDQVWMPRTWSTATLTNRIEVRARPTRADALQARLIVSPSNHLFAAGVPAEVGLDALLRFPGLTVSGQVDLVVRDFPKGDVVLRKSESLVLPSLGQARVKFALPLPPGFYEAVMTARQVDEELAVRSFPFACDIEHMTLPDRPADFDRFWDATLAEQEKTPANLQLNLHKDEAAYRLYKIRFDGLMGRQFHGWLSIPKKEGKFPAHLQLPPSGINPPYMPYMSDNVVGMTLAIAGQETEPPPGGYTNWDYFRSGIDQRETWYYRAVFAACSRAVDLLAARPEVDASRIFVTGGSQGGGLTFITAALNPKVTMAVSGSPGFFGLEWKLRHLPPQMWPPIDPVNEQGQPMTDAKALEARIAVARYADAANFAPRITGRVLVMSGLQDHVTSQAAALAAWSRLSNARTKALLVDPWAGHNGPRGGQGLNSTWWLALMAGEPGRVETVREAGGLPVLVEVRK